MQKITQIVQRKTAELIPYARNARTHSEEQVAQIAASIKEFGFNAPIAVDKEGVIIYGHGRLLAAQKLGLDTVPVVCLDHLTETQKRAFIIADNKLALNAGWDADLLKVELDDLQAEDFNLDLLGFSDEELDDLLGEENQPKEEPPIVEEPSEKPKSQVGDVWILGAHRLACGDATDPNVVRTLLEAGGGVI